MTGLRLPIQSFGQQFSMTEGALELLQYLARQVGHDDKQAISVSSKVLNENFGDRKAQVEMLLSGMNRGFASQTV